MISLQSWANLYSNVGLLTRKINWLTARKEVYTQDKDVLCTLLFSKIEKFLQEKKNAKTVL